MTKDRHNNPQHERNVDEPFSVRHAEIYSSLGMIKQIDTAGWAAAMHELDQRAQQPKPAAVESIAPIETTATIHNLADYRQQPAPSIMTLPLESSSAVHDQDEEAKAQRLVQKALDEAA